MVAWQIALATMALSGLAEWLHVRRIRRLAYLIFGPQAQARRWVRGAAPLRVVAMGLLAWGMVTLWQLDSAHREMVSFDATRNFRTRHIVLALDVSPSMHLTDAGPRQDESRAVRAREVIHSLLERIDLQHTQVSVIAFYSGARPVVVDTTDAEVIANILNDLPLEHAFQSGKTNLYEAITAAAKISESWQPDSASLVLVSDGDTLPAKSAPQLSPAYSDVLILGVGDPYGGKYIDGHTSRQDSASLEQLASSLRGSYLDTNARHVPDEKLRGLAVAAPLRSPSVFGRRETAVVAIMIGAFCLALVGPLLSLAGGAWKVSHAPPHESFTFDVPRHYA